MRWTPSDIIKSHMRMLCAAYARVLRCFIFRHVRVMTGETLHRPGRDGIGHHQHHHHRTSNSHLAALLCATRVIKIANPWTVPLRLPAINTPTGPPNTHSHNPSHLSNRPSVPVPSSLQSTPLRLRASHKNGQSFPFILYCAKCRLVRVSGGGHTTPHRNPPQRPHGTVANSQHKRSGAPQTKLTHLHFNRAHTQKRTLLRVRAHRAQTTPFWLRRTRAGGE